MTAVPTLWPEVRARRGMVATPHRLASEAGVAVFERGGNALDGVAVSPGQRRVTAQAVDLFTGTPAPEIRQTLWPRYHPARLAVERFVQPELATTFTRVAEGGADEFYRGALARQIAEAAAG